MTRFVPLLLPIAVFACKEPEAELALEPDAGPMSGYFEVSLDAALDVTEVRIGGIKTIQLSSDGDVHTFVVQGHPEPGPSDVEIVHADGTEVLKGGFTWNEGTVGFETFVAMGASLSQGVQGGVPTQHGQLHSPSRFIANQTGAYHPVPLHIEGLFPPIRGEHITPAPECKDPGVADHLLDAAIDVLAKINDQENNRIGFYLGLEDPELRPYNVATGNSGVPTMVHGPDPDDFAEGFLARFVFDPWLDIADDIEGSQLELVEGLAPTVIMCSDTYGNDLLGWRPIDEVEPALEEYVDRLSATGAEVFLANIPRVTHLPGSGGNAERDQLADDYKAMLDAAAARHDNVHVVDFYTAVEDSVAIGVPVGDKVLPLEAYGGLLSTDGLHLSDVGYAWEANLFIDKMNEVLGTDIESIDLAEVYPTDEHRPEALVEQGIDPACIPEGLL